MRKLIILWAAGVGIVALTQFVGSLRAAAGDETNKAISRMADLLEKGDGTAAKKIAKDVAEKDDLEMIMSAFKLRTKKGIGVGTNPNTIIPDGIELKIEALVKDGITPEGLKKEGPALARAGYIMAAVATVAHNRAPEIDVGKQKKADWLEWTQSLIKASEEFSIAAKGNSAADLKKVAAKVKQSCDSCHSVFK